MFHVPVFKYTQFWRKNLFCLQKNCNFVLTFSKNFIAVDPYLLSSQDNKEGILPYGIVLFYCYCILF